MRRPWLIFAFVLSSVKEQGDIWLESVEICLGFALHSVLRSWLPSWHSHTLVSGFLLTSLFCAVISSSWGTSEPAHSAFLLHDNWACFFILFQFEGVAVLRVLLFLFWETMVPAPSPTSKSRICCRVFGWEACWGLGWLTRQEQTRTGQGEPTRFQPLSLPATQGSAVTLLCPRRHVIQLVNLSGTYSSMTLCVCVCVNFQTHAKVDWLEQWTPMYLLLSFNSH